MTLKKILWCLMTHRRQRRGQQQPTWRTTSERLLALLCVGRASSLELHKNSVTTIGLGGR